MSSNEVPHVAVVVLNWNGWQDTIACVESVLESSHSRLSVIICDNASRDDSIVRIQAWGRTVASGSPGFTFIDRTIHPTADTSSAADLQGTVTLLQAGRNGGYASGNNVGVRTALTDSSVAAIWILNNDTVVDEGALTEALGVLSSDPHIGLVGATLRYLDRVDVIQCQGGGRFNPRKGIAETIGAGRAVSEAIPTEKVIEELDFINGAAVLVSRQMLETVGLMAEHYFLYWEELDWASRARPRFKLSYAPAAIVMHKVGAAIGTKDGGEGSDLSEYYYNRNRIRFCQRHSRRSLPYVYLQLSWNAFQALLKGRVGRCRLLARVILGLPGPVPA
jgi:GT2 family glycosyltransferase